MSKLFWAIVNRLPVYSTRSVKVMKGSHNLIMAAHRQQIIRLTHQLRQGHSRTS